MTTHGFRSRLTLVPRLLLAAGIALAPGHAENSGPRGASPRIYIQPQDGFESYISAAMVKKHVPAVVTQDKSEAQFVLTGLVEAKEESSGSKIARCLFAYCAGIQGTQTATVQLIDARTQ